MLPSFITPEQFGDPGSTQDDAPLIQAAVNCASERGGGIVWLDARSYTIRTTISIRSGGVILAGCAWGAGGPPYVGTWLNVANPAISAIRVDGGLRSSPLLRDFAIRYDQPHPRENWTPLDSPFALEIVGVDDVTIQNILLHNVTRGIRADGAGRVHIDKVFGQPMLIGIELDGIQDSPRVNNIHFWPFWSNEGVVDQYTKSNGIGILCKRCDNPHFANVFFLAYLNGLRFSRGNNGSTSKFRVSQIDCDFCQYGVLIDGADTTGQVVNFTSQGSTIDGSIGIRIAASGVKLQAANVRVTDVHHNAIRVEGEQNSVALENTWIDGWNRSNRGFPAIEAGAGSTICVGSGRWFARGRDGHEVGGDGKVELH